MTKIVSSHLSTLFEVCNKSAKWPAWFSALFYNKIIFQMCKCMWTAYIKSSNDVHVHVHMRKQQIEHKLSICILCISGISCFNDWCWKQNLRKPIIIYHYYAFLLHVFTLIIILTSCHSIQITWTMLICKVYPIEILLAVI